MGKHSAPDSSSFYRSLAAAALRATLAAAVLLAVVIGVAQYTMQRSNGATVVLGTTPATSPTLTPTPVSTPVPPPTPTPTPAPTPTPTPSPDKASARETTVQVLDGTGDPARRDAVVALLTELGYDVVAVNPAGRSYPETTLLYTDGAQAEAEALAALEPRFGQPQPNTDWSETVDLHVVVGTDWPR